MAGAAVDSLFAAATGEMLAYRRLIAELALAARLPGTFGWRENVEAGGLMSHGNDVADTFRRSAGYVDGILKGANPAELPFQRPTKFELVINLKTAKALGLTGQPLLLTGADRGDRIAPVSCMSALGQPLTNRLTFADVWNQAGSRNGVADFLWVFDLSSAAGAFRRLCR